MESKNIRKFETSILSQKRKPSADKMLRIFLSDIIILKTRQGHSCTKCQAVLPPDGAVRRVVVQAVQDEIEADSKSSS